MNDWYEWNNSSQFFITRFMLENVTYHGESVEPLSKYNTYVLRVSATIELNCDAPLEYSLYWTFIFDVNILITIVLKLFLHRNQVIVQHHNQVITQIFDNQ